MYPAETDMGQLLWSAAPHCIVLFIQVKLPCSSVLASITSIQTNVIV